MWFDVLLFQKVRRLFATPLDLPQVEVGLHWRSDLGAALRREDRILIKYLNPSRADWEQTVWLGNFDHLEPPIHTGTQRVPYEPVVAEWLFFPHPTYRQGVILRFAKKTPVTLYLPNRYSESTCQAAVHFPMRSGEEVSLGFTTREELPH